MLQCEIYILLTFIVLYFFLILLILALVDFVMCVKNE